MIASELAAEFRNKVCAEVDVEAEGLDRYLVHTPFMFDDGDHFAIVLKRHNGHWMFTDEGHTFMHLSYADVDVSHGTRKAIIDQTLLNFRLVNDSGELVLHVPDSEFGNSLFSFLQAIVKITDTAYWTRERIRSTFLEDFRNLLEERIPPTRRVFDYTDPTRDPEGIYPIDCRANGSKMPLYIFAINNDTKCANATIIIHQFEKWTQEARTANGRAPQRAFHSMAIFEDQTQINSKTLARFSDVADKLFSSLGATDRISQYLGEVLGL